MHFTIYVFNLRRVQNILPRFKFILPHVFAKLTEAVNKCYITEIHKYRKLKERKVPAAGRQQFADLASFSGRHCQSPRT